MKIVINLCAKWEQQHFTLLNNNKKAKETLKNIYKSICVYKSK